MSTTTIDKAKYEAEERATRTHDAVWDIMRPISCIVAAIDDCDHGSNAMSELMYDLAAGAHEDLSEGAGGRCRARREWVIRRTNGAHDPDARSAAGT